MNSIEESILIIAEVGSVHDGSFGNAKNMVSLASDCNADVVKFQTHIAKAETLKNAPMPSFFKGEPRFEYFERTSFDKMQWLELFSFCKENEIEFMSSPFSIEAVSLLEDIGVSQYKIPSGEVTNTPLIQNIAATKKPVILSSGMSTWEELDHAINILEKINTKKTTILQCTTEYPCRYENVGLNVMVEMKDRYGLPFGLSDHTTSNYASFAAVTLGASIIEKHLTFSKKMYGSDAKHSSTPEEFMDLVNGIRSIETMKNNNVDKDEYALKINEMREVFQKSIVSNKLIKKGTVIQEDMIGIKKPGTGIEPKYIGKVLGKKAQVDIPINSIIKLDDLVK